MGDSNSKIKSHDFTQVYSDLGRELREAFTGEKAGPQIPEEIPAEEQGFVFGGIQRFTQTANQIMQGSARVMGDPESFLKPIQRAQQKIEALEQTGQKEMIARTAESMAQVSLLIQEEKFSEAKDLLKNAYKENKDFLKIFPHASASAKIMERMGEIRILQGEIALQEGNEEKALRNFNRAVEILNSAEQIPVIAPARSDKIPLLRARAQAYLGDHRAAMNDLHAATDLNPMNRAARMNYQHALEQTADQIMTDRQIALVSGDELGAQKLLQEEIALHEALGREDLAEKLSEERDEAALIAAHATLKNKVTQMAQQGHLTPENLENLVSLGLLKDHRKQEILECVKFEELANGGYRLSFTDNFGAHGGHGTTRSLEDQIQILQTLHLAGQKAEYQSLLAAEKDPHKKLFFEAQVNFLNGNQAAAELTFRKFIAVTKSNQDPQILEMRETAQGILRESALRHIERLRNLNESLTEQRGNNLWGSEIMAALQQKSNAELLDRLEVYILKGEANTLDEAKAKLFSEDTQLAQEKGIAEIVSGQFVSLNYQKSRLGSSEASAENKSGVLFISTLKENPQDSRLASIEEFTGIPTVKLNGGTLDARGEPKPETLRVVIGPQGGKIILGGYLYDFSSSETERVVALQGDHLEATGQIRNRDYQQNSAVGVRAGTSESALVLNLQSSSSLSGDKAHWEMLERGWADSDFAMMLHLGTGAGLEKIQTPEEKRAYLLEVAEKLRHRQGSYQQAREIYQGIFEKDFLEAKARLRPGDVNWVRTRNYQELRQRDFRKRVNDQLKELKEKNAKKFSELYPEGWPSEAEIEERVKMATEQVILEETEKLVYPELEKLMEEKQETVAAGTLTSTPELHQSLQAWQAFKDSSDPFNHPLEFSDEGKDMLLDEAVIFAVTTPISLGAGAFAAKAATGARSIRQLRANFRAGSLRYKFAVGATMIGTESVVDFSMNAGLFGGEFSARAFALQFGYNLAFHGGGRLGAKLADGMGTGQKQIQRALQRGEQAYGKRLGSFAVTHATMATLATGMGQFHDDPLNSTLGEQYLANVLRMVGTTGALTGYNRVTGNHHARVERLAELRGRRTQEVYQSAQRRGLSQEESVQRALKATESSDLNYYEKIEAQKQKLKNHLIQVGLNPRYEAGQRLNAEGRVFHSLVQASRNNPEFELPHLFELVRQGKTNEAETYLAEHHVDVTVSHQGKKISWVQTDRSLEQTRVYRRTSVEVSSDQNEGVVPGSVKGEGPRDLMPVTKKSPPLTDREVFEFIGRDGDFMILEFKQGGRRVTKLFRPIEGFPTAIKKFQFIDAPRGSSGMKPPEPPAPGRGETSPKAEKAKARIEELRIQWREAMKAGDRAKAEQLMHEARYLELDAYREKLLHKLPGFFKNKTPDQLREKAKQMRSEGKEKKAMALEMEAARREILDNDDLFSIEVFVAHPEVALSCSSKKLEETAKRMEEGSEELWASGYTASAHRMKAGAEAHRELAEKVRQFEVEAERLFLEEVGYFKNKRTQESKSPEDLRQEAEKLREMVKKKKADSDNYFWVMKRAQAFDTEAARQEALSKMEGKSPAEILESSQRYEAESNRLRESGRLEKALERRAQAEALQGLYEAKQGKSKHTVRPGAVFGKKGKKTSKEITLLTEEDLEFIPAHDGPEKISEGTVDDVTVFSKKSDEQEATALHRPKKTGLGPEDQTNSGKIASSEAEIAAAARAELPPEMVESLGHSVKTREPERTDFPKTRVLWDQLNPELRSKLIQEHADLERESFGHLRRLEDIVTTTKEARRNYPNEDHRPVTTFTAEVGVQKFADSDKKTHALEYTISVEGALRADSIKEALRRQYTPKFQKRTGLDLREVLDPSEEGVWMLSLSGKDLIKIVWKVKPLRVSAAEARQGYQSFKNRHLKPLQELASRRDLTGGEKLRDSSIYARRVLAMVFEPHNHRLLEKGPRYPHEVENLATLTRYLQQVPMIRGELELLEHADRVMEDPASAEFLREIIHLKKEISEQGQKIRSEIPVEDIQNNRLSNPQRELHRNYRDLVKKLQQVLKQVSLQDHSSAHHPRNGTYGADTTPTRQMEYFSDQELSLLLSAGLPQDLVHALRSPRSQEFPQALAVGLGMLLKNQAPTPHTLQELAILRVVAALRHTVPNGQTATIDAVLDMKGRTPTGHRRGTSPIEIPGVALTGAEQAFLAAIHGGSFLGIPRVVTSDNALVIFDAIYTATKKRRFTGSVHWSKINPVAKEILGKIVAKFGEKIQAARPQPYRQVVKHVGVPGKVQAERGASLPVQDAVPAKVVSPYGTLRPRPSLIQDIESMQVERPSLAGQVPGLTLSLERIFDQGGYILKNGEDYMLVDLPSGAATSNPRPATAQEFQAYLAWKAELGFGGADPISSNRAWQELQIQQQQLGLPIFYHRDGRPVNLRGAELQAALGLHGEQIAYLNTLLKGLPDSVLKNHYLREIHINTHRMGEGRFSSYDPRTGELYIYQGAFQGSPRNLVSLVLHELGHPIAERYDLDSKVSDRDPSFIPVDIRDQMAESYHEILKHEAFFAVDFGRGPESRKVLQREDFKEFIADLNLAYVTAGPRLRQYIESLPEGTPAREAWEFIYHEMKNRIYEGREYGLPPGQEVLGDNGARVRKGEIIRSFPSKYFGSFAAYTDSGRHYDLKTGGRDVNEDGMTELVDRQGNVVGFLIEDGMGGNGGGDLASQYTAREIRYAFHQGNDLEAAFKLASDKFNQSEEVRSIVEEQIQNKQKVSIPGAVAVGFIVKNQGEDEFAHVGDARGIQVRRNAQGVLEKILETKDQSYLNDEIIPNEIELEQITGRPRKRRDTLEMQTVELAGQPVGHIVTGAMGAGKNAKPVSTQVKLEKGDFIVMGSDGLWDVLRTHEILEILDTSRTPAEATQRLKSLTHERMEVFYASRNLHEAGMDKPHPADSNLSVVEYPANSGQYISRDQNIYDRQGKKVAHLKIDNIAIFVYRHDVANAA